MSEDRPDPKQYYEAIADGTFSDPEGWLTGNDSGPNPIGTVPWIHGLRADDYKMGTKHPLDHGVKIRAKVKRGTDTRDQDELLIEGRGADADEAAEEFEAALSMAEAEGWASRLRALQPGEADGDE